MHKEVYLTSLTTLYSKLNLFIEICGPQACKLKQNVLKETSRYSRMHDGMEWRDPGLS